MRALAYDVQRVSGPGVQAASFDQILEASDVISLHVPLTAGTATLIGAAELARMKPNCLLINTARSGLVDEHALADALRAGRIGGAGSMCSRSSRRAPAIPCSSCACLISC
jgi:glycerate dehydrogenase